MITNKDIISLKTKGYVVVNIFSEKEISQFRNILKDYVNNGNAQKTPLGKAIETNTFCKIPELRSILENQKLFDCLKKLIDEDVRYLFPHSDFHWNCFNSWHKDVTRGTYINDPWEDRRGQETFGLYKVAFYLQDHSNDDHGFTVVEGSHLNPVKSKYPKKNIYSKVGDVIIFDQRIDHVGRELGDFMSRIKSTPILKNVLIPCFKLYHRMFYKDDKMSIFFGVGKNNKFSTEFITSIYKGYLKSDKIKVDRDILKSLSKVKSDIVWIDDIFE